MSAPDELSGGWGTMPLREPGPSDSRFVIGDDFATADDVLAVVALVRCARERDVLAAVLRLDRTVRGLAPVLLAELRRAEFGEHVSEASAAGAISTGDRFADIDAYPLWPEAWAPDHTFRLDCRRTESVHLVTPAVLSDIGAAGTAKLRADQHAGRRLRPRSVDHDHVISRWSAAGR